MEQNNQRVDQKSLLPIKTKLIAWCITVIGGIGLIISMRQLIILFSIVQSFSGFALLAVLHLGLTQFIPSLFFLLSGLFLFKRKRWTWWFSIVMLILAIIIFCFSRFLFSEFF